MTIDIFIRTYHKDIDFLRYCLKSIAKYVTGHRRVIICIPEDEGYLLKDIPYGVVIMWHPLTTNGYIDQQISKLSAHEHSNAEYILFVDSDVCFFQPTDLSEYFVDGKPYLMKTRYELVGDAICWKACTEEIMGLQLAYEYMRRIPILFRWDTLYGLANYIDIKELAGAERLSEFNLLGAYAAHFQETLYHIINTEHDPLPKTCAKQGWSWGGMTDKVRAELEAMLNK